MLHQSLPFYSFPPPHSFPSSSSMSPPTIVLHSQVEIENFNEIFFSSDHQESNNKKNQFTDEFLVDDLLDLREMPEPEKKSEENEEHSKESSFLTFEKTEPLLLSEITLPEETEAAHLEWLSRFVHDCHSPEPPASTAAPPIAALKSKRSRRRRRRRADELWSLSVPPPFGYTSPVSSHASSSSSYQQNSHTLPNFERNYLNYMPKKRGRKPKSFSFYAGNVTGGERRCAHCGVQKTPQWRAGPGGPKTLCNACGVRFKSGRLLPEYRPACSPTFISKIHSNSHRKVLEMRRKKDEQVFLASGPVVRSC